MWVFRPLKPIHTLPAAKRHPSGFFTLFLRPFVPFARSTWSVRSHIIFLVFFFFLAAPMFFNAFNKYISIMYRYSMEAPVSAMAFKFDRLTSSFPCLLSCPVHRFSFHFPLWSSDWVHTVRLFVWRPCEPQPPPPPRPAVCVCVCINKMLDIRFASLRHEQ